MKNVDSGAVKAKRAAAGVEKTTSAVPKRGGLSGRWKPMQSDEQATSNDNAAVRSSNKFRGSGLIEAKLKRMTTKQRSMELQGMDVVDEVGEDPPTEGDEEQGGGKRHSLEKSSQRMCRTICQTVYNSRFAKALVRICAVAWAVVTCHRGTRRRVRESNAWLEFPDREERRFAIRAKQQEQTSNRFRFQQETGDLPRHKQLWCYLVEGMDYMKSAMNAFADEWLGYQDKETGLPTRLTETWRFVHLDSVVQHGYLYKAIDPTERTVAIMIRDKSRGHVVQLPTQRAAHVLRRYVVPRKHGLGRLLAWLGIHQDFTHRNVAKLYAVFDNPEFYVEVSEYLNGGSLAEYLDCHSDGLDEYAVCHIFMQILMALRYMHANRLMHRDLRLAQVLLVKGGKGDPNVKLSDFWCVARIPHRGVLVERARALDAATSAPEALKTGDWSDKADIWSAGCILFQLLYGHLPFGGEGKALLERICTQDPKFDMLCGRVSDDAVNLLKLLLHRQPASRPTAKLAMEHSWFGEFSGRRPQKVRSTKEFRISHVAICGKVPRSRHGMHAENLISAETGTVNAGFCTYMGSTTCTLEFEVGVSSGGQGAQRQTKMYFVTKIVIMLLGSEDNPREIKVQAKLRPEGEYFLIASVRVVTVDTREVTIEIHKPLTYVSLRFNSNFGGRHGIALRKISFYGFEIRAIPVVADLNSAMFRDGAHVHMYAEIKESQIKQVHPSICQTDLRTGQKTQGFDTYRYLRYNDIHSGPPHIITAMALFVPPMVGVKATMATWDLRYVSHCHRGGKPPQINIFTDLAREERLRTREVGKVQLFSSGPLHASEVQPEEVLTKGYISKEPIYLDSLCIPMDKDLGIEVSMTNNSGYCHFPSDIGLTFYYVPELAVLDDDVEEVEADKAAHPGSPIGSLRGHLAKLDNGVDMEDIACMVDDVEPGKDEEEGDAATEGTGADDGEQELGENEVERQRSVERQRELGENKALWFGKVGGPADSHRTDRNMIWNPNSDTFSVAQLAYDESDCQKQKFWWESDVHLFSQTSTRVTSRDGGIQSSTNSRPSTLDTQQRNDSRALAHIPNADEQDEALQTAMGCRPREVSVGENRAVGAKEREKCEEELRRTRIARRSAMGQSRVTMQHKNDRGVLASMLPVPEELSLAHLCPCCSEDSLPHLCREMPCSEGGIGRSCPGSCKQNVVCVRPVLQDYTPPPPPSTPRLGVVTAHSGFADRTASSESEAPPAAACMLM